MAAPDLRPIALTSPFTPDPGDSLEGLGLAGTLVLPHDDRPGRAEHNRRAREAYGEEVRMVALPDDRALEVVDGRERVIRSPGSQAAGPPAPPGRG